MRLNKNQLRSLMKNVDMGQMDANKVIIKRDGEDIIVTDPQITELEMRGEKTYQISGKVKKVKKGAGSSKDNIKLIMEKTGASKEEAEEALEEADGEVAQAILKLK